MINNVGKIHMRLEDESFGTDSISLDRAKRIVEDVLYETPVSPGVYRNSFDEELEILEPAGIQMGLWHVLGEVWIARTRDELGDRAVLVTTEFVRTEFFRVYAV